LIPGCFSVAVQLGEFGLQRTRAKHAVNIPQHLQMDRPQGMNARRTPSELGLLLLNPVAHLPDDRGVLSLQTFEFLNLFCKISPANGYDSARFGTQICDSGQNGRLQNMLTPPQ
jgi:hypothetical protein